MYERFGWSVYTQCRQCVINVLPWKNEMNTSRVLNLLTLSRLTKDRIPVDREAECQVKEKRHFFTYLRKFVVYIVLHFSDITFPFPFLGYFAWYCLLPTINLTFLFFNLPLSLLINPPLSEMHVLFVSLKIWKWSQLCCFRWS